MQRAKLEVLAHFIGDNSASKLLLFFVCTKPASLDGSTGCLEELIAEDGQVYGLICWKPHTHVAKTDLSSIIGLHGIDLVNLATEIPKLQMSI